MGFLKMKIPNIPRLKPGDTKWNIPRGLFIRLKSLESENGTKSHKDISFNSLIISGNKIHQKFAFCFLNNDFCISYY